MPDVDGPAPTQGEVLGETSSDDDIDYDSDVLEDVPGRSVGGKSSRESVTAGQGRRAADPRPRKTLPLVQGSSLARSGRSAGFSRCTTTLPDALHLCAVHSFRTIWLPYQVIVDCAAHDMKTPGIVSVSPARTLVQKILICGRCFFLLHLVVAIIAGRRMRQQSPALDFIERQARVSQTAQQRAHVRFILDGLEDMERCLCPPACNKCRDDNCSYRRVASSCGTRRDWSLLIQRHFDSTTRGSTRQSMAVDFEGV